MEKKARSYKEIIKDCLENRNNTKFFNEFFKELTKNAEFNNKIWRPLGDERGDIFFKLKEIPEKDFSQCYNDISHLNTCLIREIKKNSFKTEEEQNKIRINKNEKQWKKRHKDEIEKNNELEYIPRGPVQKIVSADGQKDGFSSSIIDDIAGDDNVELSVEEKEINEFKRDLRNEGITKKRDLLILLGIFALKDLDKKTLLDIHKELNEKIEEFNEKNKKSKKKDKKIKEVRFNELEKISHMAAHGKSLTIKKLFKGQYSFTDYSKIVGYLLKENNKKLKIPELILDFNKIRTYLSVLLLNDNIKDRTSLMKECNANISSYEKDVHRILSLFKKTKENIFDLRDKIKNKNSSINAFLKIYNTHTAANLVSNFLLLHILKKNKDGFVKLDDIVKELFANISDKSGLYNFRKSNLLQRLNELQKYGLVLVNENKNKYTLSEKFLAPEQKEALKYVVPFFCGLYPFPSIGHFLAGRLDIEDLFEFEAFNFVNTLDDCITYDLMYAVNNNVDKVILKYRDSKTKEIKPTEIITDNKENLLKVIDNKNESYYLNEIDEVTYFGKPENLIFSEIYSCYYKVFEELINNNSNISETLEKYTTSDAIDEKKYKKQIENIIAEILPRLSVLKGVDIPLTNLELRWLKTIIQDERFDLFVEENKKSLFDNLIKDVEPFNLTSFKIYDGSRKINITAVGIPDGINKYEFRKKLNNLHHVMFSVKENKFEKLSYKTV